MFKKHSTSLPGAPDGEYVVIEFITSFSNKKSAIETVTPKMENGVFPGIISNKITCQMFAD